MDESIYFDHLVSCPDRVLLDPGLAVDSESMDVRCTIYDAKGDTSVPPYDDAVAISQRENPDVSRIHVESKRDRCSSQSSRNKAIYTAVSVAFSWTGALLQIKPVIAKW